MSVFTIVSHRDHPRVCGEQSHCWCRLIVPLGSSPRVRGAAVGVLNADSGVGIIPACAGSSF